MLLDTYASFTRIDNCNLKFKSKTQLTLGLVKSISIKNKLFTNKFINKRDPILRKEVHSRISYSSLS